MLIHSCSKEPILPMKATTMRQRSTLHHHLLLTPGSSGLHRPYHHHLHHAGCNGGLKMLLSSTAPADAAPTCTTHIDVDNGDVESLRALPSTTVAPTLAASPLSRGHASRLTVPSCVPSQSCSEGAVGRRWWRHKAEDCLWLASAAFILYYGDFRFDFFTLLANDARVLRIPLHAGLLCLMLNICIVMLYIASVSHHELQQPLIPETLQDDIYNLDGNTIILIKAPTFVQLTMLALGSSAFILMCFALWPIWSFLTIPMLFTLFMAFTVIVPYLTPSSNSTQSSLPTTKTCPP